MTLEEFVRKMIDHTLGMLKVQIGLLEVLKEKTTDKRKAAGIQEAIDVLYASLETGQNITDEEIGIKARSMKSIFETILANKIENN